jgi:hypothetical protein
MSRTLIGKVEVDPTNGKIYLDGKESTRTEVDVRIMAAQSASRKARLEKQIAKLDAAANKS